MDIVARAIGKYSGAYVGAAVTHAPETVKKYLGFTLLECASIIQGTIAAAAVINEIIAVYMAKKGFEWAGELNKAAACAAPKGLELAEEPNEMKESRKSA